MNNSDEVIVSQREGLKTSAVPKARGDGSYEVEIGEIDDHNLELTVCVSTLDFVSSTRQ